jgi:hypothetical protein
MRAHKSMAYLGIGLIGFGVWHYLQTGDNENLVSRVPAAVAGATGDTSVSSIAPYLYTGNYTTGDEYRAVLHDPQEYADEQTVSVSPQLIFVLHT